MSDTNLNVPSKDDSSKVFEGEINNLIVEHANDTVATVADVVALAAVQGLPQLICKATGQTVQAVADDICSVKVLRIPCGGTYVNGAGDKVTIADDVDDSLCVNNLGINNTSDDDFAGVDVNGLVMPGANAVSAWCLQFARTLTNAEIALLSNVSLVPGGIGPFNGTVGEAIAPIDGSSHFTDPDSEITSYSVSSTPAAAWLSIDGVTGEVTGTPPVGSDGVYAIVVVANLANGQTVDCPFQMTLIPDGVDLTLTKTVSPTSGSENDQVVYTFDIVNNSTLPATGVTIEDFAFLNPGQIGFVSVSEGSYDQTLSPTGGQWIGIADIPAGQTKTVTLTAQIGPFASGVVQNTATVSSAENDPVPADNTDTANLTIVNLSDLSIAKTVDNPIPTEGDAITYSLTVSNGSSSGSTNVIVTDLLPAGLTFVSSSPAGYDPVTGVWNRGNYGAANIEILQIVATVDAGTGGQTISNGAVVTAGEVDPDGTNNTSSVDIVPVAPNVGPSFTGAIPNAIMGEVTPGSTVALTGLVTDPEGDLPVSFAATGLPAGLAIDSATGVVSGAPEAGTGSNAGTLYTVTVTPTDSLGNVGTSSTFDIVVFAAEVPDLSSALSVSGNATSVDLDVAAGFFPGVFLDLTNTHPAGGFDAPYTISLTLSGPEFQFTLNGVQPGFTATLVSPQQLDIVADGANHLLPGVTDSVTVGAFFANDVVIAAGPGLAVGDSVELEILVDGIPITNGNHGVTINGV